MKKLVVFAVALIAAVMSQAASLDWQAGTSSDLDATVYVMLGGTATTEWESADVVSAAAIGSGTVTKSGRNGFAATGKLTNDGITKTSANVYYVIVAADGASFSVTSVSDMTASVYDTTAQESSSGANTSLSSANITVSGKSFGGNPPPGPTPGDTPEPTSGLLLLVGGAALALRRKQK